VLLTTLLLRYHGWNIINLGQNVPYERMQQTIQAVDAHLIILCAMTLETAGELYHMTERLQSEDTLLAYGGLIFSRQPSLVQRVSAHYLGDDLTKVPQRVEYLLKNKPRPPRIEPVNPEILTALDAFKEHQLRINAQVLEKMAQLPSLREFVNYADVHLSKKIAAALTFGDLDLMHLEIGDIRDLIDHYGYPASSMDEYLELYQHVLQENLDERGKPLFDWFESIRVKAGG
jgi:hypothetical protein